MKKLLEWKPVRFGLEVGELYFSKRVSRSAAELAYFLILTFFPVLICINAFIGLLHLDINAVLEAASPFLPRETLGILGDYIQYITGNQSPALLAAGGIMTLFSASAAFRALMNIMEDLYGRKSYAGVWRIAASVAFSVLFLLTIYLALVVLLTGGWLFHLVERLFRLETVTLPWDWQWFRFLLLFLLVFLLSCWCTGWPRPEAGHGRLSLQVPFWPPWPLWPPPPCFPGLSACLPGTPWSTGPWPR